MEKNINNVVPKIRKAIDTFKAYEKLFDDIDTVDPSRRRFEAIACRGLNRKNKRK